MRLYIPDRHTEAMAIVFYSLPTNIASIRILLSGVKQYVARYRHEDCPACAMATSGPM
jgi:hypothetical protein